MSWPSIDTDVKDLAWKFTHSPTSVTRRDELVAASIISAYCQMVNDTQKKRNMVCKALKHQLSTTGGADNAE